MERTAPLESAGADAGRIRALEIGSLALALGLIDAASFAEMLATLSGAHEPSDQLWVEAGKLSEAQLAVVQSLIGAKAAPRRRQSVFIDRFGATMALGAEPEATTKPAASGADPIVISEAVSTDRYVEVKTIGEGGMGSVHECIDLDLGRRVAVKLLHPAITQDPAMRVLLEQEARLTGRLEHPNIVPIYDLERQPDGSPFYVMRMIRHPTLARILDQLSDGEPDARAKFPLRKLLGFFLQACNAVHFAHRMGVVHCDLKPDNILVGEVGEVLVADWGLAIGLDNVKTMAGGTLGYMPPEQLSGGKLDPRSDIFALGAILYDCVALEPAIEHGSQEEMLRRTLLPIAPLHVRCPGRNLPVELSEICQKAMAVDPASRYGSVTDLVADVEAFLEGTPQRRRKVRTLVEEGLVITESYLEHLQTRAEQSNEIGLLRRSLEPGDAQDKRREIWDAEERLALVDSLGFSTFQAAVASFDHALELSPDDPHAHEGLAQLYTVALRRAQEQRDAFAANYFQGLRGEHSGTNESWSSARLDVDLLPAGCSAVLQTLQERGHRLEVEHEQVLVLPVRQLAVPAGTYTLQIDVTERAQVRVPLFLYSAETISLELDLGKAALLAEGEVFVPAGIALLGDRARGTMLATTVDDFAITRFPVTFSDYMQFVGNLMQKDPAQASAFLPATRDGTLFWEWTGQGFRAGAIRQWLRPGSVARELPAFGMTARGAMAYARWQSRRTGRTYRLPTADEWEKAARGTDGRRFPWGDYFDASFCKMRDSRAEAAMPEAVGAFESDVSPYGVRDLAGGVADWVFPSAAHRGVLEQPMHTKGGAWCDLEADCEVSSARPYDPGERSPRIGLRLVRTF